LLLELAIGDAYGAGFEFADAQTVREKNDLSRYVKHPRHRIQPGSYTDDTQMSLAIAEIAQDLPVFLFDGLENGAYGREYIQALDTKLMAFFAPSV
jgi:ADP-ribosylglycohydrolase